MGALVHVHDGRGRRLGSALYSSSSQIAIRMISSEELGAADLLPLVRRAPGARHQLSHARCVRDADAYRVVFSEARRPARADRGPLQRHVLSLQVLTQAMDRDDIRQACCRRCSTSSTRAAVVERVDPRIRELEQLPPREEGAAVRRENRHAVRPEWRAVFIFTRSGGTENRRISRPAGELRGGRALCPRRGARRLLLPGRFCVAPGERLLAGDRRG